jgi:hypothetical protein
MSGEAAAERVAAGVAGVKECDDRLVTLLELREEVDDDDVDDVVADASLADG